MSSVKLSFEKRGKRLKGSINHEFVMKMFNMCTDISKSFEYLLATGNLVSKTGTSLCVIGRIVDAITGMSAICLWNSLFKA